LDGVTYSDDILSKIHPDDIKSVTVLKDRSITEKYGEKGKNGVILIETKSVTNNSLSIAGVKGETGKDQPIDISIKEDGVSITRIKSPSDNVVFGANKNAKLPLIVVDGIAKKKEFRLDDINPTTIGSINVIKGKGAVDKYGENAKGGAIEVITKTK
jgi:TonB-dependent SusC/RagA subfamily outer membrane receptor